MSNLKKYPSKYSANTYVSAAQYITELICEKKAKIDKKDLPSRFWNLPVWKSFFKQQILAANGLLKIYEAAAIINALKSKKAWNIYSLRAPHLDAIIEEETVKLSKPVEEETCLSISEQDAAPRQQIESRQDIINKLRKI